MKSLILVLTILLVHHSQPSSAKAKQDLTDFVTSVFSYYKLNSTSNILNCFSDSDSHLFFDWMQSLSIMETYLAAGNYAQFQTSRLLFTRNEQLLQIKAQCVFKTTDFAALLKAINLPENYDTFAQWDTIFGFYVGAYPNVVAQTLYNPVYQLNQSNYKSAGTAFAPSLQLLDPQTYAFAMLLNTVLSFYNGWFIVQKVPSPSSLASCIKGNDSSIINILDFYNYWALAIQKNVLDPQANFTNITQTYLKGEGKNLYSQINSSIISCFVNSADGIAFKQATGYSLDPMDPQFINGIYNLIQTNKNFFVGQMSIVATDLKVNLFFQSGMDFGRMVNLKNDQFWVDDE